MSEAFLEHGTTGICVHCGEEIIFYETPIDNFWTHMEGIGKCSNTSNFAWPVGIEEPQPLKLTLEKFSQETGEWETMSTRDTRWEDMYACVASFTVDSGEKNQNEFLKIGIYVWYQNGFYWGEQYIDKDDINLVDFNLVNWILTEMVKVVDGYIEAGIKE